MMHPSKQATNFMKLLSVDITIRLRFQIHIKASVGIKVYQFETIPHFSIIHKLR